MCVCQTTSRKFAHLKSKLCFEYQSFQKLQNNFQKGWIFNVLTMILLRLEMEKNVSSTFQIGYIIREVNSPSKMFQIDESYKMHVFL